MPLTLNGDSFKRDNCLLNRVGKKLERGMIALTVRWVRGVLSRFSQQGSPEVPVRGGPITPSSREPPHRLTLSWDSFFSLYSTCDALAAAVSWVPVNKQLGGRRGRNPS